MLINKQYQEQQRVFYPYPRHHISHRKTQVSNLTIDTTMVKQRVKKANVKRLSCYNFNRANQIENQSFGQKAPFSNKILDHFIGNIKENFKTVIKQKGLKQSQMTTIQHKQANQRIDDSKLINYEDNLKIKSINGLIQRKIKTNKCQRNAKFPFNNHKISTLRKGKPQSLYTQQRQNEFTQKNQNKLLPWQPITDNGRFVTEGQEESLEDHYLKSHNLKVNEEKIPKYNSITFQIQQKVRLSYKKCSSVDIAQNSIKSQANKLAQIFSGNIVKPINSQNQKHCVRNRKKNNQIDRTLTEMKMQIQQFPIENNSQFNPKSLKIQQLFNSSPCKNMYSKRHTPSLKNSQSSRKDSLLIVISNSFIMCGKKI